MLKDLNIYDLLDQAAKSAMIIEINGGYCMTEVGHFITAGVLLHSPKHQERMQGTKALHRVLSVARERALTEKTSTRILEAFCDGVWPWDGTKQGETLWGDCQRVADLIGEGNMVAIINNKKPPRGTLGPTRYKMRAHRVNPHP